MGRAFEFRKNRKMKRWDAMAKAFTKVGREMALAIKTGGADPENNTKLRIAIQNAKGVNMPRERIEAALKRGLSKDEGTYEELVYEGYGPFGVAMMIDCTTDNPTRTVANMRKYFSRGDGAMGTNGSVAFMFDRKGSFVIEKAKINLDAVELDLIDGGAEDITTDDDLVTVIASFADFGHLQKKLEDLSIEVKNSELIWVPQNKVQLTDEQMEAIYELIDKFEEDDDVVNVFHSMDESD